MGKDSVFFGEAKLNFGEKEVNGKYAIIDGEDFFLIENYSKMRPFFMTIVSANDHWLFIASNGGLSAGRKNPEQSLFPYYSDDKIISSTSDTGSKSIFRVKTEEGIKLWEPFTEAFEGIYNTSSNLYKNREGNKIIFEETNHDLGLCFRYGWMFSEEYGIVKKSQLINLTSKSIDVEVLDGIRNILPFGVSSALQDIRSTLVDAYKRCELDKKTNLAIYSLSSMIVDKAEPSEALKATTVWSVGIEPDSILLSSLQLKRFRNGSGTLSEMDIKAEKGAFFITSKQRIAANKSATWLTIAEVNQSVTKIAKLQTGLSKQESMLDAVLEDINKNKQDLRKKIGLTDGIQLSKDRLSTGRHFSNVLFNIMRGGTFDDQYEIETADFLLHIKQMNMQDYQRLKPVLNAIPDQISYHSLRHFLVASKHQHTMRYYLEYLPLSFSRRHGDPSRPWNHFSIETKDEYGNKLRNFEGNWRDIFQNWEALAFSYPEFALGMVAKFVNASTIDGYNPYRISREGIDWEIVEPSDPWSHIGYWGDHQVIYLCKLLEISLHYQPERLKSMLSNKIFTYANVPYRIKGYDAIASNPKDTINFDHELEASIKEKVSKVGSDGKLVWNKHNQLERVNLTEKLLVMVLTKLYNFIPDAGIWLNTQRPEWNDANNALVGNGVSMVTLYYLRRLLNFASEIYKEQEGLTTEVNKPVVDLMEALKRGFTLHSDNLNKPFSDKQRRQFMDDFGVAGEHYRTTAYAGFTGEKRKLKHQDMLGFFALSLRFLEDTIDKNSRADGLYHSYNLVELSEGKACYTHLYEMLEGQVSALSANYLKPEEALKVLDSLKTSKMFRSDQYSYMLYPDRELSPFLEKNIIDPQLLKGSQLLDKMLSQGNTEIIERDIEGKLHFNGSFHNVNDLKKALLSIKDFELKKIVKRETKQFLLAFEAVFDHKEFTGRSGAFYGYEGLGSIYWHMVSKLLLAIQENIYAAKNVNSSEEIVGRLIEHYYEIRAGIGVNKSPELYGAFPTDAYSHTPKYAGAKQPGMTGQVKEDIINRWAELGIHVKDGCLTFEPFILRKSEFIAEPATLSYYNHNGDACKIEVPVSAIAFTYCQIPIVYEISNKRKVIINYSDGTNNNLTTNTLNILESKDVFKRSGKIQSILVQVLESDLI